MGGHYRTNIISSVGHPRLDSIVPLVLCTGSMQWFGHGIVLQVPQDSDNLAENG
jgi:hypothetical protein